jgi:hypothetical protein
LVENLCVKMETFSTLNVSTRVNLGLEQDEMARVEK